LTLTAGVRYIASRPFAGRGRDIFPVTIAELRTASGWTNGQQVVARIDGLTYDAANRLLNAFNNGATSFEGRVW